MDLLSLLRPPPLLMVTLKSASSSTTVSGVDESVVLLRAVRTFLLSFGEQVEDGVGRAVGLGTGMHFVGVNGGVMSLSCSITGSDSTVATGVSFSLSETIGPLIIGTSSVADAFGELCDARMVLDVGRGMDDIAVVVVVPSMARVEREELGGCDKSGGEGETLLQDSNKTGEVDSDVG